MSTIYQKYFDQLDTNVDQSKVSTPNWLIKIIQSSEGAESSSESKALTSSKIPGFENFCTLISHQFAMHRKIERHATETVKPDGGLSGDHLKIVTEASFLNADFNTHFHMNNCLEIEMVRIVTLNTQAPKEIERYKFEKCYVTGFFVQDDLIAASFRYATINRSVIEHTKEGENQGSTSSQYSFVTSSKDNNTNAV